MEKKIITNYKNNRYEYPLCNGEDRNGWIIKLKNNCKESNKDFFERLVQSGYTKISFYEVSTRIRGLHNVIAYVKK